MEKFFRWCSYYHCEITWFLIGFLLYASIDALGRGNYVSAIINFALVAINYFLYRKG